MFSHTLLLSYSCFFTSSSLQNVYGVRWSQCLPVKVMLIIINLTLQVGTEQCTQLQTENSFYHKPDSFLYCILPSSKDASKSAPGLIVASRKGARRFLPKLTLFINICEVLGDAKLEWLPTRWYKPVTLRDRRERRVSSPHSDLVDEGR